LEIVIGDMPRCVESEMKELFQAILCGQKVLSQAIYTTTLSIGSGHRLSILAFGVPDIGFDVLVVAAHINQHVTVVFIYIVHLRQLEVLKRMCVISFAYQSVAKDSEYFVEIM
jgi:hypothetical protein